MPVVKKCKCIGGCQRLPHYEPVVLDRGEAAVRAEGEEGGSGEVTGQGGEEVQVPLVQTAVDVGRCSGSCPTPKQQCIP